MAIKLIRKVAALIILLLLIWYDGPRGFAALLYTYAARTSERRAADAAVNLSPDDAESHRVRGALFEVNGDHTAATEEYARAVSLRPEDYTLWLGLAHVRESSGDKSGAIAAAEESVRRAQYYFQPHWQLGNLFIRSGDLDRGFAELRLAAASNPSLLPSVVDLAWQLSDGSAEQVKQFIQPNSSAAYIALADLFRKHEKMADAVAIISSAGPDAGEYRKRLLENLISAKHFPEAHDLWLMSQPKESRGQVINNPGFEQEADLDRPGFEWRAGRSPGIVLLLDNQNPREGSASLKIEFKGESEASLPIIAQLAMVDPGRRYKLLFAARNEQLVSGGLPALRVLDAVSGEMLGESVVAEHAEGWRDYTIDFSSKSSTIQIALQRQTCSRTPCPIFGVLWLDNFSLQQQ